MTQAGAVGPAGGEGGRTGREAVRVAVVGLGKMGLSHCAILNADPRVDLVAVCDASRLVRSAMERYTDFRVFRDAERMVDEIRPDCLVIATPSDHHERLTGMALERHLHVFVEKPFCLDVDAGAELVRLAQSRRLVNQVGFHSRFVSTFVEARRLVRSGVIGDVFHFQAEMSGPNMARRRGGGWRERRATGGGCLFDFASHVINLVSFVLAPTTRVSSTTMRSLHSRDVDDAVYATLHCEGGACGHLSANWSDESHRKAITRITFDGTRGQLSADATSCRLHLREDCEAEGLHRGWNERNLTDLAEGIGFYLRGEEYTAQLEYFVGQIISGDTSNVNSFESALETDRVLRALMADADHDGDEGVRVG